MKEDLTYGEDIRGDYALFIERKHFKSNGWEISQEAAAAAGSDSTFFRVIENGVEQAGHGWIEDGKVFQWG